MKKRVLSLILALASVTSLFGISGCNHKKTASETSSSVSDSVSGTTNADASDGTGTVDSSSSSASDADVKSKNSVSPAPNASSSAPVAENPNNKIKVEFVKQGKDIVRQDNDGNRRLIYVKITNVKEMALNKCNLYYTDKKKAVTREIGLIFLNSKYTYETFWLDASYKGNLSATIKNDGEVVWQGSINIQPAASSYVIGKSKCYSLSEMKPMMLRGVNYFNRYECWGKDWQKDDFTASWDADFKEMSSKLNINTVRAFTILDSTLLYQGQVPTSETIIKIGKFLEVADKYHVKVLMCLWGGNPKVSECMGDNLRFIRGVVEPFQNDGRIIMWDLMNEPDDDNYKNTIIKGMSEGGALDAALKTLYPKLKNEFAPHQMTCIGTGFRLEKLQKIGLTTQIGSWHGYIQSDLPVEKVYQEYAAAANKFWGGKRNPFLMQEWGYPSQRQGEENDEQYQLKVYQSYIPALLKLRDNGYRILGSYQWTAYDYPAAKIAVTEQTHGIIRKNGTVKPAGVYLANTYADLRKAVPAPWEK